MKQKPKTQGSSSKLSANRLLVRDTPKHLGSLRLRKKPKAKKLKFIIVVIFFLGASYFLIRQLLQIPKLQEISCDSQYGQCSDYVYGKLEPFVGKGYITSLSGVRQVLADEPLIEKYRLQVKLPLGVKINVIENKPIFAVSNTNEGTILVEQNGIVLNKVEVSDLPTVYTEHSLTEMGEKVSSEELFALNLILDLYKTYQIKSGKITNDGLVIELPEGLRHL